MPTKSTVRAKELADSKSKGTVAVQEDEYISINTQSHGGRRRRSIRIVRWRRLLQTNSVHPSREALNHDSEM